MLMWLDATEYKGMTMQTVSTNKSYGGAQGVYRHASQATGTDMAVLGLRSAACRTARNCPWSEYLSGLDLHACQCHREGRIPRAPAPSSA